MQWHETIYKHVGTTETIIKFLKATSPTPVYGTNTFKFRYDGTQQQVNSLRNQLRVALTRIRKKATAKGVKLYPFTLNVSEPEQHTIDGVTFYVLHLARQTLTHENPFENVLDAEVMLSLMNPKHVPTKTVANMIETLLLEAECQVELANWSELCAAIWLIQHNYAEPEMNADNSAELLIYPNTSFYIKPRHRIQHLNPQQTSLSL